MTSNQPFRGDTESSRQRPISVLPTIVAAQVLVTSTWFAANAVAGDIGLASSGASSVGRITLMVQLGFIAGTLILSTSGLADRIPGRRLFLFSSLAAALTNSAILYAPDNHVYLMFCRFGTGVALAGVYPIGMKMAASWFAMGLGRALGYLVGALVLGTALTHLIRAMQLGSHWQVVIIASSIAAMVGGGLMSCIADGPHLTRTPQRGLQFTELHQAWKDVNFRQSVLAYYGHMWELYTFWAFVPRWIGSLELPPATISLYSFMVIAVGAIGCAVGGWAAEKYGSRAIARSFLAVSALCCGLSPMVYGAGPWLLMPFLIVWGIAVVGDSPQLSSLCAQAAPRHLVGSALTATTCIGFSITVVSLLALDILSTFMPARMLFWPLTIGPLIGYWMLRGKPIYH